MARTVRPPNFAGIRFHELVGSGERDFGDSQRTVRRYLVDYDDADKFAQELTGHTRQVGSVISRYTTPAQDPERPWLYCKTARISGYGDGTSQNVLGAIKYTKAQVTATFQTLDRDEQQNPQSQTFITESIDSSLEVITLTNDDSQLYWKGDQGRPLSEDARLGMPQAQLAFLFTIHNYIGAPVDSTDPDDNPYLKHLNKINRSRFRALHTSFKEETFLYMGYSAERSFTSEGVSAWTLQVHGLVKPDGWNKFLNPETLEYEEVKTKDGKKPYKEANLDDLLP